MLKPKKMTEVDLKTKHSITIGIKTTLHKGYQESTEDYPGQTAGRL